MGFGICSASSSATGCCAVRGPRIRARCCERADYAGGGGSCCEPADYAEAAGTPRRGLLGGGGCSEAAEYLDRGGLLEAAEYLDRGGLLGEVGRHESLG